MASRSRYYRAMWPRRPLRTFETIERGRKLVLAHDGSEEILILKERSNPFCYFRDTFRYVHLQPRSVILTLRLKYSKPRLQPSKYTKKIKKEVKVVNQRFCTTYSLGNAASTIAGHARQRASMAFAETIRLSYRVSFSRVTCLSLSLFHFIYFVHFKAPHFNLVYEE